MRKKTFLTRPPRWKKRLLYFFAFFGAAAFSGLAFTIYLSLQVSEDHLKNSIPFPKLVNTKEKTEPIPDVTRSAAKSATEKSPAAAKVPAYAQFYNTSPPGEEPSKLRAPKIARHRSKILKRAPGAVKAKGSS